MTRPLASQLDKHFSADNLSTRGFLFGASIIANFNERKSMTPLHVRVTFEGQQQKLCVLETSELFSKAKKSFCSGGSVVFEIETHFSSNNASTIDPKQTVLREKVRSAFFKYNNILPIYL